MGLEVFAPLTACGTWVFSVEFSLFIYSKAQNPLKKIKNFKKKLRNSEICINTNKLEVFFSSFFARFAAFYYHHVNQYINYSKDPCVLALWPTFFRNAGLSPFVTGHLYWWLDGPSPIDVFESRRWSSKRHPNANGDKNSRLKKVCQRISCTVSITDPGASIVSFTSTTRSYLCKFTTFTLEMTTSP